MFKDLLNNFFNTVENGRNLSLFLSWITHLFITLPGLKRCVPRAGIKLVYLPPYSPDFNPNEEFFAELKTFVKLANV